MLDDQLVDNLARLSWRRLVNLCRGLIADLAPEQVEERSRLARAERYVRRLATDDPSVAFVSARVDTADAVFLDAMVDRIADLLETHGDTDSKDLRRAKSLGILATPARATLLLAEAAGHLDDEVSVFDGETSENDSALVSVSSAGAQQRSAGCDVTYGLDGGQKAPPDVPAPVVPAHSPVGVDSSTLAATVVPSGDGIDERTASVWRAARQAQPRIRWTDPRLLPKSTIYLHVAEDTVMHGRGPVRAEGIGPLSATMIGLLVGHTGITVKPVIRPYDDVAVDAYEIPRRIREQVILRDLVEVFPYSSRPARNQQLDHTRAYRKGPPGQTGPANLGPLSAKVHRAKTHGHWNLNQPKPGVFWWRSPAGNRYRVTPSGVTRINLHTALGRAFGETLWQYDQRPDQPGQSDP